MALNPSIITKDLNRLARDTANVYESVAVISRRARQISAQVKEELTSKLAEFATTVDNLEEIFENREQIEISRFYERMPKSTIVSVEEFLNEELTFRYPEEEGSQDYY
jgi:DNA-directed RNA polymerase subunit K/omega